MKRNFVSVVAVFALAGLLSVAWADEKKETTLRGHLQCGKCSLKEKGGCANVLVVKEGDAEVRYTLTKNEVSKPYNAKTCGGDKIKVSVTGTVAETDGKKMLTATKITEG